MLRAKRAHGEEQREAGSQDGWARVQLAQCRGEGPRAKKTGGVYKKHKEAAVAKVGLHTAVKKDQKHEGEKPGRHPLREGM